jgi:amino acid transporter
VSDVATALSPLDTGNAAIYNVPLEWAGVFAIPATYATAFGFIFSYGRLLESMSQSGLMPAVLSLTTTNSGQPYVAMLAGSLIGYFICLVAFYYPFVSLQLFNVCCLLAFVCYCCQCFSYWMVVTRFQNIPRSFRSPLGLAGAVWAASVFLLGAIAVIFFQKDGGFAVITVLCLTSLFSLYYYTTVVNTQCFSPDESTVMFKAYVINANYIKNRSRKQFRGRAKGGSEVTSFSDHIASLTLRAASWLSGGISPVSATSSAKVYAFSDSAAESESQATLTQTQTQSQTHATASKIGGGESSVADALVLEEAQTEESF